MASTTVVLRNEANTATTNLLTDAFGVEFQVQRNQRGTGTFMLPIRSAGHAAVATGSVVLFQIDGEGIHPARVIDHDRVLASVGDEFVESTSYVCEGLLGDWDGAVVQLSSLPQCDLVPTLDERIWNWASGEYSTNVLAWPFATEIALQGWGSPFYTGQPAGWNDGLARYLWHSSGNASNAPPGTCLFYETFLVGAGKKVLDWAADNYGRLFVNGKEVQDGGDFRKKQTYEFETTSGFLTLAWMVENAPDDGPPGGNPGGLIASLRNDSSEGVIQWRSTSSMRVLGYPSSIPGLPVGQILRLAKENNLIATTWTVAGSDTLDAAGNAYPEVPELAFRIYTDTMTDVLAALTEVWIDVLVDPVGKVLYPYVKGFLSDVSTLTLVTGYSPAGVADPDIVNIEELSWAIREPQFTKLAARDADGWFVRGSGDAWGTYRMEQINHRATAEVIADRLLELFGVEQRTASFRYIPLNEPVDLPFSIVAPHDTLAVPWDNGTTTVDQVVDAITVRSDDEGRAEFIVEVGDPLLDEIQRTERAIQRGAPGSLRGLAASASAASGKSAHHALARMAVSTPSAGAPAHCIASAPNAVTGVSVALNLFAGRVTTLRLVAQGASGSSTVTVSDGTTSWVLTGTGEGVIAVATVNKTWTTGTWLTVTISVVGHTNLHVYADVVEVR